MAEEEERTGRNLIACLARHVQSPPSSCRQHQTIFRRIFFGTQHDIKTGSEQTLFVYSVVAKKLQRKLPLIKNGTSNIDHAIAI